MDIDPKCFKDMPQFLSCDGFLYPCCFVYTNKDELANWAKDNNQNINDLNIQKYSVKQIKESNFMKKFNKSFDTNTCRRECGKLGYSTSINGQPKWKIYKINK